MLSGAVRLMFLFATSRFRMKVIQLPFVQGITSDLRQRRIAQLYRRLAQVQKNERLTQREYPRSTWITDASSRRILNPQLTILLAVVPDILSDAERVMTSWGAVGACDPFEKIHEVNSGAASNP